MSTIRQERVSHLLFQELSILVESELADPRLTMVTVLHVDVSKDLRSARAFVSHNDDEVEKEQVMQALIRATPFLRRQLAARCDLRVTPELHFTYDESPERAARITDLLAQIAAERETTDDQS